MPVDSRLIVPEEQRLPINPGLVSQAGGSVAGQYDINDIKDRSGRNQGQSVTSMQQPMPRLPISDGTSEGTSNSFQGRLVNLRDDVKPRKPPSQDLLAIDTPDSRESTAATTALPTVQRDAIAPPGPVDTLEGAPTLELSDRAPQTSSFVPRALTETGIGTTYQGQSEEQILDAARKGLVTLLDEEGEYIQLSRQQGARAAEARGLGGSSLRERAAQGAAISAALPLVQQAGQLASAERQTAQQVTAQSEIAAANRRLSEMQQQLELAVQSGDNAAARQLQSDIAQEQNRLQQWQTEAGIASNEAIQNAQNRLQEMLQNRDLFSREQIAQAERDLQVLTQQRDQLFREEEAQRDRQLQERMQAIDIEYKQWLEGVTFEHQGILQGNAQAAGAYSDFTEAAMNILNNPETTSAQKKASIDALKEALSPSLTLIGATANIDLSQFLPGGGIDYSATGYDEEGGGGGGDIDPPIPSEQP